MSKVDKPQGASRKLSISPSQDLINEAIRQVDAGIFDTRTDFFEAAGWLLIEMQGVGADMLEDTQPDNDVAESMARLTLVVSGDSRNPGYRLPQTEDDDE